MIIGVAAFPDIIGIKHPFRSPVPSSLSKLWLYFWQKLPNSESLPIMNQAFRGWECCTQDAITQINK